MQPPMPTDSLMVRPYAPNDAEAVALIYRPYVLDTTISTR
jgi:hypothetical protein